MLTNKTLLIIFSIIYVTGLSFVYFSKTRIDNKENRIYKIMLITNIIGLILQLVCDYVSYKNTIIPKLILDLVYKLYVGYFIVFINLMFMYLIIICFKKSEKIIIKTNFVLFLLN